MPSRWQCLSVCLSVRPSIRVFQTFFNILWDINLKRHEEFEFHRNRVIWSTSTPRNKSNTFLQLWPQKSSWILQIWYIGSPLYTSRHNLRFVQKSYFRNFGDYFSAFWIFRIFLHQGGTGTHQVASFIAIGTLWPTLQPKIGQMHFSVFMVSWSKTLRRGNPGRAPASETFCTCFEISIWNLGYTFNRWCNTLSRSFIVKIGHSHFFSIYGLKNYIEPSDSVHTLIQ